MAFVIGDRVKETSTTTGTGTLTLAGAVAGFLAFSARMANNDTTYYAIKHQSADEWEVGTGTWTTGNNLARSVIASSNSDALVNFSAGTKDVFMTHPASSLKTINDLAEKATPIGADQLVLWDSVAGDTKRFSYSTVRRKLQTIGITVDGGGSAIGTGTKGYIEVPFAGTILEWKMIADQSGSCVMDVWVDAVPGTIPDNADTITAAAKPTLTAQQNARSSTLTGWTTAVDINDIFGFEVESASTVTRVTLELVIEVL